LDHLENIRRIAYLAPQFIEMPPLRVIGLMTVIDKDPSVIPNLWDLLELNLKKNGLNRAGKRYAIYDYPIGWEIYGRLYTAAIEAPDPNKTYPPLISRNLPRMHYLCLIHRDSWHSLQLTLDFVYQTWNTRSGKQLSYQFFFESHKVSQDPKNLVGDIELYFPFDDWTFY
jgi:predicted transcriptional regulator YdeE